MVCVCWVCLPLALPHPSADLLMPEKLTYAGPSTGPLAPPASSGLCWWRSRAGGRALGWRGWWRGALALLAPCYGIALIDMSSLFLFRSCSGWLSSILGKGWYLCPLLLAPCHCTVHPGGFCMPRPHLCGWPLWSVPPKCLYPDLTGWKAFRSGRLEAAAHSLRIGETANAGSALPIRL